jgi:Zn-finger nucleic acid-binding protein
VNAHPNQPASFDLRCPKDGAPMHKVMIEKLTIDRCVACGAMWFDVGEIERVLKMKKKVASDIDAGATRPAEAGKHAHARSGNNLKCPRDKEPLAPRMYPDQSHIVVDECKFCHGMLLDSGELSDASDFTLAERVKSFFS